jgi:hypothetical protein
MNKEIVLKLRHEVEVMNHSLVNLVDEVERKLSNPNDAIPLNDFQALGSLMKKKRKESGITLEDLELQTDLSLSTLKRLFADPSAARFSNVVIVLNELGIKAWAEL